MPPCPVCNREDDFAPFVDAQRIGDEAQLRDRFIEERLTRPATADELKDLTDFFHGAKAEIQICRVCQLLWRNELEQPAAGEYSEDNNDPAVMEHQYPRYLAAFRAKEKPYRALLPAGANVLEIGSHYGAFLEVAQHWNWRVQGVDVGKDTSAFARSHGLTVHNCELADCSFAGASFDAIFIWNCFEQIPVPKPLLAECRRLLRPGGLLVVRTPNGLFYRLCQELLAGAAIGENARDFLLRAMAYNNLLAFPYLYGHSRETLTRLIEPLGFASEGWLNSELLTLPLPEDPAWVQQEEHEISAQIRLLNGSLLSDREGTLTGPWAEVWFRAQV